MTYASRRIATPSLARLSRRPPNSPAVVVTDGVFRIEFDLPPGQDEAWVELAVRAAGESTWSPIPGRTKATAASSTIGQCWSSTGDDGSNPTLNFLGTTDAQPLVLRTRNVQSLRLEPSSVLSNGLPITANVIAGSGTNVVAPGVRGATIAGGGMPFGSDPDFDDEGANRVFDAYGTVGGGYANLAGNTGGSVVESGFATVAGGAGNVAAGLGSAITGGQRNLASGGGSSVGGGGNNQATGDASVIGGGLLNFAPGDYSTVGGGIFNCAGAEASWAGGNSAKVRPGTSGEGCAGVPTSGVAGDVGTFVWSGSSAGLTSTGPNQFLVSADGGMAINTNTPAAGAALTVNGNVAVATIGTLSFGSQTRQMLNLWGPAGYGIGVQSDRLYFRSFSGFSWFQGGVHNDAADNAGTGGTLRMRLSNTGQLQTTTGTLSTLSDARLKDQIADYSGALDRINALRPVTYHYRDAGTAAFQPEGTHLGFVAQEMQQVFPQWVSEDDDGHLVLSMRGFEAVAVAAGRRTKSAPG
jgi:trimeric autotransporter adhesin